LNNICCTESDLKPGFHENYTFDHMGCCVERGLSPLCRAMCKPRDMGLDFFDPTRFLFFQFFDYY
jgi:hypothetical protein